MVWEGNRSGEALTMVCICFKEWLGKEGTTCKCRVWWLSWPGNQENTILLPPYHVCHRSLNTMRLLLFPFMHSTDTRYPPSTYTTSIGSTWCDPHRKSRSKFKKRQSRVSSSPQELGIQDIQGNTGLDKKTAPEGIAGA